MSNERGRIETDNAVLFIKRKDRGGGKGSIVHLYVLMYYDCFCNSNEKRCSGSRIM